MLLPERESQRVWQPIAPSIRFFDNVITCPLVLPSNCVHRRWKAGNGKSGTTAMQMSRQLCQILRPGICHAISALTMGVIYSLVGHGDAGCRANIGCAYLKRTAPAMLKNHNHWRRTRIPADQVLIVTLRTKPAYGRSVTVRWVCPARRCV